MAIKIKHEDVINFFKHINFRAKTDYQNIFSEWRDNKQYYVDNLAPKLGSKMDWQNSVTDGLTDNLITRMTNFFTRILITEEAEYYDIFSDKKELAAAFKARIKTTFNDNNFPLLFADAFKYSLSTSPFILKIYYRNEDHSIPNYDEVKGQWEEPTTLTLGKTKIKVINPFNIMCDQVNGDYIIETQHVSLPEFLEVAKLNDWNVREVNKAAKDNRGGLPNDTGEDKENKKDSKADNFVPLVKLDYVCSKYITDHTGKVLVRDVEFIIANDKHLLEIRYNRLPSGRFPYVIGFPMKSIYDEWTRGYVSKLKSLIRHYTDSFNLMLDSFKLSALGIYEYDITKIPQGQEHAFSASLYPGKWYPTKGQGSITSLYRNEVPPLALNIIMFIDRLLQNRSFQTEFFTGAPTAKGRPTATEVNLKTQETTGFFTDIASELERSVIVPTLELVLMTDLLYSLTERKDRLRKDAVEDETLLPLTELSVNEAMAAILESKFEARGISGKIIQLNNYNKLLQILGLFGNIPMMIATLDPFKVTERVFSALGEDPKELIDPESLNFVNQLKQAQLQQLLTGGNPAGPSGNRSPNAPQSQVPGV